MVCTLFPFIHYYVWCACLQQHGHQFHPQLQEALDDVFHRGVVQPWLVAGAPVIAVDGAQGTVLRPSHVPGSQNRRGYSGTASLLPGPRG